MSKKMPFRTFFLFLFLFILFEFNAAAVPTSSVPTKAKIAIWKAPKNPLAPLGKNPPLQMLENWAWAPLGVVNSRTTMKKPTTTSAMMATILMMENQNSISPKALTVARLVDCLHQVSLLL